MSGPYGRCDLVGVGVLEQVAGRTGFERRLHALLLGERGQRHDLHVVVASPDLTGRLDAVEGLHLKVHQDHVGSPPLGVQPGEQVERMRSSVGIADDLEVGLAVEEGQQPAAHDRVIVDHQHADPLVRLRRHPSRLRLGGTSTRTTVPSPGVLVIVRSPPTSAARLRIDSRPK